MKLHPVAPGECDCQLPRDFNRLTALTCNMPHDKLSEQIARISRDLLRGPEALGINIAVIPLARTLRRIIKAISCFCLVDQVHIDVMRRSLCVREPSNEMVSATVFRSVAKNNTSRAIRACLKFYRVIFHNHSRDLLTFNNKHLKSNREKLF